MKVGLSVGVFVVFRVGLLLCMGFIIIIIIIRVHCEMSLSRLLFFLAGLLVVEEGPEVPNARGDDGANQRADPVDPVVDGEGASSNGGTQASGRVQAGTGVVYANQVSDEKRDTNTDWGKVV